MLSLQVWRAIRLVLDTGIHSKRWTREQAIAYFKANSSVSDTDIAREVDRYFNWPGQATSYMVGQLKIAELRRKAERELGDKFDIRDFHEAVLSQGALPLDLLEAQVNAYMDATGVEKAILWFYNKDTSHRHAVTMRYNPRVVEQVRLRFQRVLDSTPECLPDREYSPQAEVSRAKMTGREYLPWQCSYCPFTERCWSSQGFKLQIDKGKPRWLR
jgi:hypothetical protein